LPSDIISPSDAPKPSVSPSDAPKPSASPPVALEDMKLTMVEDFESYQIGTEWNITTGEYPNTVTATVEQDQMNPDNKVLRIDYDGTDQAYDVAPIFSINLNGLPNIYDISSSPVLDDFEGFTFKTKVECNSADCVRKPIYAYFDDAGKVNESYYFATTIDAPHEGKEEIRKFKRHLSMAYGDDSEFVDPVTNKIDNHRYFPYYYNSRGYPRDRSQVSPGFSDLYNDEDIEMTDRIMYFSKPSMKDSITGLSLLDNNSFDLVFGSTYSGEYQSQYIPEFLVLYIDDLQLISRSKDTNITSVKFDISNNKVGLGLTRHPNVQFTPENTSQRELLWSSSDESILSIDEDTGYMTGKKLGKATIKAISRNNPSISAEQEIVVHEVGTATEDINIFEMEGIRINPMSDSFDERYRSDAEAVYVSKEESTAEKGEGLHINYMSADEVVVIDLGRDYVGRAQNSGD
jgi:hypothetical protein